MLKLLFIALLAICVGADEEGPVLSTHVGKFQGRTIEFGETKVDAFYGLPFAKPPIKERRFEKPTDTEPSDKLRQATVPKPACSQPKMAFTDQIPVDEDCLYLNVFKPKTPSPKGEGYPVLVFVHGGAYQVGSAHMHSMDAVAENFAARGIVFIAPQYRLGLFGFASTGPKEFAGNYGLWDLRRALLWIRKNAKALDLNLKKITVGGYSAGSAAVGALTVSEHSRDLFTQAIQMSGSIFGDWATSNKAITLTEKLATALKCDSQSSTEVKKCLRKFSFEELYKAFEKSAYDPNDFNLAEFTPRLDAEFFTSDFPELIQSAPPKPTLATITENEGILFTLFGKNGIFDRHALDKAEFEKFGEEEFKKFVSDKVATESIFGSKAKEVQNKINKFYLGKSRGSDPKFYKLQYAKILADMLFVTPQLREMRYKAEAGWPVFMVKNTHRKPLNWGNEHPGMFEETTHGQEYGILFGLPDSYTTDYTKEDDQHREILLTTIVDFVKTRSPKTDKAPHFEALSRKHPLIYTEISTTTKLKSPLFGDELNFWNELTKDYDFDLIRGIHKKTLRSRTEL
ncbi:Carboxylic ester hydrolase [Aphelenchoides bicaudatus]|nr:Carboxylic ester hydrolase [Aphelenchoides bicaudatus]